MEELEELMEKWKFPPELIFNMDETMMDASGYKVKVITRANSPRPFTENESKMEHITLGLCISASGGYLRPLCILPLKTLPPLEPNVVHFYSISGQENGFISKEIWHEWVRTVFIPHVNSVRQKLGMPDQKVLLLVDSHSTRKHEPTIKLFEENNILVFILPAHSSTILQPLDLTCNKELKRVLRLYFLPLLNEDRATKRNRLLHTSVLCLQSALTALQITTGFARAGIWPFSKEAPLNSNLVRNPLQELEFQAPIKRKRGPSIAGKVLTNGVALPPAITSTTPSTSSLPTPPLKKIAPLCSAQKIDTCTPSLIDFVNL